MTVITNERADSFIEAPPIEGRLYLVHGADEGLVHERARRLVSSILDGGENTLRLTRLDADDVAEEPGLLSDEVRANSMFGDRRIVWLDAQSRDLTAILKPVLACPPRECTLIVEAKSMRRGAPMRAAFEIATNAYSIECRPDEKPALLSVIASESRAEDVVVTESACEYLQSILGSDRLISRGEIKKLMLYAGPGQKVDLSDVEAIVASAAPAGLEAVIDDALEGELEEVERAAGRFFTDGGDAGYLVTRLILRVVLLNEIRLDLERGRSIDGGVRVADGRLAFARGVALENQAKNWTSAALRRTLPPLRESAARSRVYGRLRPMIITRLLWALAAAQRQKRV